MSNQRAQKLADRLLQGADAMISFAENLSEEEWKKSTSGDGRTIGVIIHHVASSYPAEIELAQKLASGKAIEGVTPQLIDTSNAQHAKKHTDISKQATVELLIKNSQNAAEAVKALTDEELDRAAPVSLNSDAPLTAQFFIEDHALRHSFHHLARLKSEINSK